MGANQSGAAIGVAVIGTGNIAQSHLTAWKRLVDSGQARLEVACDNDLERARVAAERYGAAAWATDFEEAVRRPEVQAVDICLPHHLHLPAILAAARAGKHVLCEKPLARSAAEAKRMAHTCQQAGVLLAEAWMTPFNPPWDNAVREAESGALGELRSVRGEFTFTIGPGREGDYRWDPEQGGGSLLDVGIYATGAAIALMPAA